MNLPKNYIQVTNTGREPQGCEHGWVHRGRCVMCGKKTLEPAVILEPTTYCEDGE